MEALSDSFDYKICTVSKDNFFGYLNQRVDTNLGGFLGTICVKKSILSEIGYFGNDSKSLEGDVITWKKIVFSTNCILVDKPVLCYYRTHGEQISKSSRLTVTIAEYFNFFNEYKNNLLPLDPNGNEVRQFLNLKISGLIINAISMGFRQKNFSYFFEAVRIINKYGYRIPVLLIAKNYCDKVVKILGSYNPTKRCS